MTTTPNLPPLPEEDGYIPIIVAGRTVEVNAYRNSTMEAYALAAYQASRNSGLDEVAAIASQQYMHALNQREAVDGNDNDNTESWNLSMTAQAVAFTRMETEIGNLIFERDVLRAVALVAIAEGNYQQAVIQNAVRKYITRNYQDALKPGAKITATITA